MSTPVPELAEHPLYQIMLDPSLAGLTHESKRFVFTGSEFRIKTYVSCNLFLANLFYISCLRKCRMYNVRLCHCLGLCNTLSNSHHNNLDHSIN